MRFFFCVDNNFKLWIKYFLVRFNVDKTLKYNIPYQHIRLPLRGLYIVIHQSGDQWSPLRTRYLPNIRRPLRGAVALRLSGGFIRDIQSGRSMVAPTHVISIHKGAVAPRLRGGIEIYKAGDQWSPLRTRHLNTQGSTWGELSHRWLKGGYYSLYILWKLLKSYEYVKQIFSPILTSIIKEQK